MTNEITAGIERHSERFIGYSPEIPVRRTGEERRGVPEEPCPGHELTPQDRREEDLHGVAPDAVRAIVKVGCIGRCRA